MKFVQSLPVLFLIGALMLMPMMLPVIAGVHGRDISCSLYHYATLDEWWSQNSWKFPNITIEEFRQFPFPDGLTQLDGEFANASPEEIQLGDILVFRTLTETTPIIGHRVIKRWTENVTEFDDVLVDGFLRFEARNMTRHHFSTVGDNWFQQPYERRIDGRQVLGKVVGVKSSVLPREYSRILCRS